jgi:hypothetical protein
VYIILSQIANVGVLKLVFIVKITKVGIVERDKNTFIRYCLLIAGSVNTELKKLKAVFLV